MWQLTGSVGLASSAGVSSGVDGMEGVESLPPALLAVSRPSCTSNDLALLCRCGASRHAGLPSDALRPAHSSTSWPHNDRIGCTSHDLALLCRCSASRPAGLPSGALQSTSAHVRD